MIRALLLLAGSGMFVQFDGGGQILHDGSYTMTARHRTTIHAAHWAADAESHARVDVEVRGKAIASFAAGGTAGRTPLRGVPPIAPCAAVVFRLHVLPGHRARMMSFALETEIDDAAPAKCPGDDK